MQQKLQILKENMSRRINLSEELWNEVSKRSRFISLDKREILLNAGTVCHYGYFITRGCLVHNFLGEKGESNILGFFEDTSFPFICSPTYFTGRSDPYEIIAMEPSEVISFLKEDLEYLAYNYPEFGRYYQYIMSSGLVMLNTFSCMRMSLSSAELLSRLSCEYPDLMNRVPDKYLARFMGISHEWFSKLKKKQKS